MLQHLSPCNPKSPRGTAGWKAGGNQQGEASSERISKSHKCQCGSPLLRLDHPHGFHQTKAAPPHPQSCTTQPPLNHSSTPESHSLNTFLISASHPAAPQQPKLCINPSPSAPFHSGCCRSSLKHPRAKPSSGNEATPGMSPLSCCSQGVPGLFSLTICSASLRLPLLARCSRRPGAIPGFSARSQEESARLISQKSLAGREQEPLKATLLGIQAAFPRDSTFPAKRDRVLF